MIYIFILFFINKIDIKLIKYVNNNILIIYYNLF